jgi:hypothetical protein
MLVIRFFIVFLYRICTAYLYRLFLYHTACEKVHMLHYSTRWYNMVH